MTFKTLFSTPVLAALLAGCASEAERTDTDPLDPTDPGDEPMDIVDLASSDDELSTLVDAIVAAGLEDLLRSDEDFTVFAPDNAAFEAAGINLDALSTEELTEILTYHVISGAEVDAASVPELADSAAGYTLFFDTTSGVRVNDANVTAADQMASNGIVHVVDQVLMPPTILDAAGYAGLDELAGAVGAADPVVADLLSSEGAYTVFAPTDDGFQAVSDITATLDTAGLTDVLTYHVVAGEVASDAIPDRADTLLANAWGQPVTALFSTDGGVAVNGSPVAIADIRTTNGIVHVVDDVLLPPTVVDLAVYGGLTELLTTVEAAEGDLATTLSGPGPFTVFAPDNPAFVDIAGVAASLTPAELTDILLFHVVGGDAPVLSTDLAAGEVETLLGETITVDLSSGVMVEDAMVTDTDIVGTNGAVHIIDTVMLPPAE